MADVAAAAAEAARLLDADPADPGPPRELLARTHAEWVAQGRPAADVAALWEARADVERRLRQFKQAVRVYEQAAACPVAGGAAAVWTHYARHFAGRGKSKKARRVLERALEARAAPAAAVWQTYLELEREAGDVGLSLEALKERVLPRLTLEGEEEEDIEVAGTISLDEQLEAEVAEAKASGQFVDMSAEPEPEDEPMPDAQPPAAVPAPAPARPPPARPTMLFEPPPEGRPDARIDDYSMLVLSEALLDPRAMAVVRALEAAEALKENELDARWGELRQAQLSARARLAALHLRRAEAAQPPGEVSQAQMHRERLALRAACADAVTAFKVQAADELRALRTECQEELAQQGLPVRVTGELRDIRVQQSMLRLVKALGCAEVGPVDPRRR